MAAGELTDDVIQRAIEDARSRVRSQSRRPHQIISVAHTAFWVAHEQEPDDGWYAVGFVIDMADAARQCRVYLHPATGQVRIRRRQDTD